LDDPDFESGLDYLKKLEDDFNAWRLGNPKEFAVRFASRAGEFLDEIKQLGADELSFAADFAPDDARELPPPPIVADNRHHGFLDWMSMPEMQTRPKHFVSRDVDEKESRTRKFEDLAQERGLEAAEWSAKTAETGAAIASHSARKGLLLLSQSAAGKIVPLVMHGVEAAGIAAAAAGLTVTLINSGFAIRSWHQTNKHLLLLKKILNNDKELSLSRCYRVRGQGATAQWVPCENADVRVHELINAFILPYIIRKKELKRDKKIATTFTLGSAISLYSVAKWVKKELHHERGVHRYKAAHWLAYHFCTCDCDLAMNIAAALTSIEEMLWLKNNGDYEGIADVLADKMKSI
jgi:hypothetical protein